MMVGMSELCKLVMLGLLRTGKYPVGLHFGTSRVGSKPGPRHN
jgi:hypothetical protein